MAVDYDAFLAWAESRFSNVKANGKEIMVDSPFADDNKNHLWCNVDGGKNRRKDGVYRCWKSDKKGTLIGLVMEVDGCTYDDALTRVQGDTSMAKVYAALEEFFDGPKEEVVIELKVDQLPMSFPPFTYPVGGISHHFQAKEALSILNRRKIDYNKFDIHFCTQGEYRNRIIIPYYNEDKKLIYWNGRHIYENVKPKYRGPEEEKHGVGKGDVLYFTYWPRDNDFVFLTEGEFDAISLSTICSSIGCACGGKYLGDKQIKMLRNKRVCLALDNDAAGKEALMKIGKTLLELGFSLEFVSPPKGFKDWNKMLETINPRIIKKYIDKHTKKFTKWEIIE